MRKKAGYLFYALFVHLTYSDPELSRFFKYGIGPLVSILKLSHCVIWSVNLNQRHVLTITYCACPGADTCTGKTGWTQVIADSLIPTRRVRAPGLYNTLRRFMERMFMERQILKIHGSSFPVSMETNMHNSVFQNKIL